MNLNIEYFGLYEIPVNRKYTSEVFFFVTDIQDNNYYGFFIKDNNWGNELGKYKKLFGFEIKKLKKIKELEDKEIKFLSNLLDTFSLEIKKKYFAKIDNEDLMLLNNHLLEIVFLPIKDNIINNSDSNYYSFDNSENIGILPKTNKKTDIINEETQIEIYGTKILINQETGLELSNLSYIIYDDNRISFFSSKNLDIINEKINFKSYQVIKEQFLKLSKNHYCFNIDNVDFEYEVLININDIFVFKYDKGQKILNIKFLENDKEIQFPLTNNMFKIFCSVYFNRFKDVQKIVKQ